MLRRWLGFAIILSVFIFIFSFSFTQVAAQPSVLTGQATPTPQVEQTGDHFKPVSLVGIAVLLAPFAWMIWKSHGKKEAPQVYEVCNIPVIDESRRPYRIPDEKDEQAKTAP